MKKTKMLFFNRETTLKLCWQFFSSALNKNVLYANCTSLTWMKRWKLYAERKYDAMHFLFW